MKKLTCTRCNKKVQHLATTGRQPKELYTICWDCLIELDINHKNFNKWILPQQYLENINASSMVWPCRKEEFAWDTAGVNVVEGETNQCQGINSSYQKKQYIPKFDGSFKSVNYDSEHNWLFGKHKGDGRNIFMGGSN